MNITKQKQHLWAAIEQENDQLIKLCSDLIAVSSENPPGNMEEITTFICNYLKKYNIKYEILRPVPERPNIVARIGKPGGKSLILNGHSDVVPAGDRTKWNFDPFSGKVENGKILGRGTSDMKGGIAGILFAVAMIIKEKIDLEGEIIMTIVPDEEISGDKGTKWLIETYGLRADACLVAEPTDINNCEIGQRGTLWLKLTATGTSAHGSLCPYVGDNAITKLMKVIEKLDELKNLPASYPESIKPVMEDSKKMAAVKLNKPGAENVLDHITINVGTIKGGIKTNVVPDFAQAEIDIRLPIGINTAMVIEKLDAIIKNLGLDGVSYEHPWRSEPNYTDVNAPIVETLAQNFQEICGQQLARTYQWASSDARYFRYAGISTMQYGPSNTEGIHTYNETVDVKDLITAAKVYVGTIIEFLNQK
jgi:succinyl-diaminopimelate desuccinylase